MKRIFNTDSQVVLVEPLGPHGACTFGIMDDSESFHTQIIIISLIYYEFPMKFDGLTIYEGGDVENQTMIRLIGNKFDPRDRVFVFESDERQFLICAHGVEFVKN